MQIKTRAAVGKLKDYLDFPSLSFSKKFFRGYFNTLIIIKGFLIASLLSLFIFLSYFEISFAPINTILAIAGFYLLLKEDFRVYFWVGFFIGLFWFYWIVYSLIYYDLAFLIPIELLFIGIIYGLIFAFIGIFQNTYIRAIFILLLSYLNPFNFNWLILELTLIDSYFGITKIEFLIFLLGVVILVRFKEYYKALAVIPFLILILFFNQNETPKTSNLKITLSKKFIPQDDRWKESERENIIQDSLNTIYKAIREKQDIVILTESAFPLTLNMEDFLVDKLLKLSKEITIIAGSVFKTTDGYYNANYYFIDGRMEIAKKAILVPFGEEVPLAKFLSDLINEIFYGGAQDYIKADEFFDIEIKGVKFRNAICFEVTRDELFQNAPDFIIANSNNGWFTPSTEPTLQNLLIKFYAKKYKKIIYHSANMGKSEIVGY